MSSGMQGQYPTPSLERFRVSSSGGGGSSGGGDLYGSTDFSNLSYRRAARTASPDTAGISSYAALDLLRLHSGQHEQRGGGRAGRRPAPEWVDVGQTADQAADLRAENKVHPSRGRSNLLHHPPASFPLHGIPTNAERVPAPNFVSTLNPPDGPHKNRATGPRACSPRWMARRPARRWTRSHRPCDRPVLTLQLLPA